MEKKYLIICLRYGYWNRCDNLVFWGKNRSGYYSDLSKAGLYTKEEAKQICRGIHYDDIYMSIDKLNINPKLLEYENSAISIQVKKIPAITKYVQQFKRIADNRKTMKWGSF